MIITNNQRFLIIDDIDGKLQSTFAFGVDSETLDFVLGALPFYITLPSDQQAMAKDAFRQVVAAFVKTLLIDKPLPAVKFTGTFSTGDARTVTVQDGIIVSVA